MKGQSLLSGEKKKKKKKKKKKTSSVYRLLKISPEKVMVVKITKHIVMGKSVSSARVAYQKIIIIACNNCN